MVNVSVGRGRSGLLIPGEVYVAGHSNVKAAKFHAKVLGEITYAAATKAPALIELDSCQCKGPAPLRSMDRFELWDIRGSHYLGGGCQSPR